MRRHAGVMAGAVVAAVGLLLAVAAFSGFAVGLPAVRPASALSASWLMIAVVLLFAGAFAALIARGLELDGDERVAATRPDAVVRPVVELRPIARSTSR